MYSDRWIEQGGIVGGELWVHVTFLIPFEEIYNVNCIIIGRGVGGSPSNANVVSDLTNTDMYIGSSGSIKKSWTAYGKISQSIYNNLMGI